jgi:enoyl-CoA hydratase/carnithine racemase
MINMIRSSREGAVAHITLDRPTEGNLLSTEALRALAAAFHAAATTDAKVILLRSTGSTFCRGREAKSGGPPLTALQMRNTVLGPILDVYHAMANLPQPIVCAVQGDAFGFGCALAAASDVTIAADHARFKLPEMEKDLPPTLAISAMMTRVHRKALTWMVYAIEELDAQTALQIGIVSRVAPLGGLDEAVSTVLATMTARSPAALNAVKDYFRAAPHMEPSGAAHYAGNLLAAVLSSAG